jgi:hypothetical protein
MLFGATVIGWTEERLVTITPNRKSFQIEVNCQIATTRPILAQPSQQRQTPELTPGAAKLSDSSPQGASTSPNGIALSGIGLPLSPSTGSRSPLAGSLGDASTGCLI